MPLLCRLGSEAIGQGCVLSGMAILEGVEFDDGLVSHTHHHTRFETM